MQKDEILNGYWYRYLNYWAKEVRDVNTPPTEDGFWVWYTLEIMGKEDSRLSLD